MLSPPAAEKRGRPPDTPTGNPYDVEALLPGLVQNLLAVLSGGLVGFSLALIGGGGSILAVPLLVYVVGVRSPHLAIGTSALAVAVNAFANLLPHGRAGNVHWRPGALFAGAGVVGALAGSSLGKAVDGRDLLALFAVLMLVVAVLMLRRRSPPRKALEPHRLRLSAIAFGAGLLAGFFGIGGGFLVVPGLVLATGMGLLNAIATSLFSVGAFGLATAFNYALSGLVDWPLAFKFILGGLVGGWLGAALAGRLSRRREVLTYLFSAAIAAVALFMLYRTLGVPR